MSCIFCNVASGEIPATPLYRDDDVVAVADINPQAPKHTLVMPVKHYDDIAELAASGDDALMAKLFAVAAKIGREQSGNGFRIVVNTGTEGGQTVEHVHVHVLAGRPMAWPPG